jgi:uncharacterized protein
MKINFEELCKQLNLDLNQGSPEQLDALKEWYAHYISSDVIYPEHSNEQYQFCLKLARQYLDGFLAKIPENLNIAPRFNDMNFIQFASEQGYDKYLNSLPVNLDLWSEKNSAGMTALHFAATKGHLHTVQTLLSKGADPTLQNDYLELPLFSTLIMPPDANNEVRKNKEIIFTLLKNQTPDVIKYRDQNRDSILHLMAAFGFSSLYKELINDIRELAFCKNNQSHYPIHSAIINRNLDIVCLLMDIQDVSLSADGNGRKPLHYAAGYGTSEIVSICCAKTNDINIRDHYQKTPLMIAVETKNLDAMQVLIEHGANIELTDSQGYNILHLAILSEDESVISWILDNIALDSNFFAPEGKTAFSLSQELDVSLDIQSFLAEKEGMTGVFKP